MRRTKTTHQHPTRLEGARRRFERWRATREGHTRIPEALWVSAVRAASQYGVCQTSRVLRLDYYSLKKRVEAAGPPDERISRGGPGRQARAGFIELVPPAPVSYTLAGTPECTLELEDACGAKMRVCLKGAPAPDLAALSRSFWNSAGVAHADEVKT